MTHREARCFVVGGWLLIRVYESNSHGGRNKECCADVITQIKTLGSIKPGVASSIVSAPVLKLSPSS